MLPVVKMMAAGLSAVAEAAKSAAAPQRSAAELFERYAAPKPAPPHGHVEPRLGKPAGQQTANGMYQRNGHEPFRLGLGQAADEVPAAHARVDQNRHGPGLVKREDQRDEVDPRPHQQGQSRSGR